jgi:hypothetical protein
MRKWVAAAILILSCLVLYAWAEEQSVNLAGSWILDQAKSDPFPRSQRAMNDSGVGDVSRGGGGTRGGGGGTRGGGGGGGGMSGGSGSGMGSGSGRGPSAGGPGGEPVPLIIEQNGNEIKINNGLMAESLTCDGKQREKVTPIPNSSIKIKEQTKAAFKKHKLIVENISFTPTDQGQPMQTLTKRTYSLSEDGKTMTLETSAENMMMSTIQKQIYNRQ